MVDYSPHIGRIFGIDVQLHWSFLLLLIALLFLSFYYFLLWVLLFVFVLLHELVHSVTSRRNGVNVKKIILYPFGGGSVIDFDRVMPDVEFRISIVGPLASLLMASLLGIATLISPPGFIRVTVQELFILNLFLGVFNLLPWLPLDGGRALRSYLQKTHNFLDSTKIAVKVGNVITFAFIAGTVVYAATLNVSFAYKEFVVLWDVVIAVFIYGGAQAELQSAIIRTEIADLRVKDVLSRDYVMIKGQVTATKLYRALIKSHQHIILFKKANKIMEISRIPVERSVGKETSEVISNWSKELPYVEYDTPLYSAVEKMRSEETGVLAVMKFGKLFGIITAPHVESVIALYISSRRSKKGVRSAQN
jgi:Zn-dependent protease